MDSDPHLWTRAAPLTGNVVVFPLNSQPDLRLPVESLPPLPSPRHPQPSPSLGASAALALPTSVHPLICDGPVLCLAKPQTGGRGPPSFRSAQIKEELGPPSWALRNNMCQRQHLRKN